MIRLQFIPWERFFAKRDKRVTTSWLRRVREEALKAFRAGINGQHSGNIGYRKGGGRFTRSAPNEYPAKDSGNLLASLKGQSTSDEAIIGTDMFYSKFLRQGTKKMARRKMSDNALQEGRKAAGRPRGWVSWAKGRG